MSDYDRQITSDTTEKRQRRYYKDQFGRMRQATITDRNWQAWLANGIVEVTKEEYHAYQEAWKARVLHSLLVHVDYATLKGLKAGAKSRGYKTHQAYAAAILRAYIGAKDKEN